MKEYVAGTVGDTGRIPTISVNICDGRPADVDPEIFGERAVDGVF